MITRFGPSGCGIEFENEGKASIFEVPDWLKARGLNAFEYSFGHGYRMKTDTAQAVGKKFRENDILVSVHAPYFINFANPDPDMYAKSEGYIRTGIKFLKAFDYADHLVFHSGFCGGKERDECINLIKSRFIECFSKMEEEGLLTDIWLCPETMGKPAQIGTYTEVVDLCLTNSHLVPTFDFGHINALTHGGLKNKEDYKRVFDYAIEKLGMERINNCHIHFSKIEYGEKGEIRHLNFEDEIYGPNYEPMIEVIKEYNLTPRIISESAGMQPRDASIMKKYYDNH